MRTSPETIIDMGYIRMSIDLMKENGFKQAKERSRRYFAQTITDADYADAIALLANTRPKPKPCYIVWNGQLVALVSMSTQTRQNIFALIKESTSPH